MKKCPVKISQQPLVGFVFIFSYQFPAHQLALLTSILKHIPIRKQIFSVSKKEESLKILGIFIGGFWAGNPKLPRLHPPLLYNNFLNLFIAILPTSCSILLVTINILSGKSDMILIQVPQYLNY